MNLSPILELSVKFASQICHENINKPLDGAYLAEFDIAIKPSQGEIKVTFGKKLWCSRCMAGARYYLLIRQKLLIT